MHHGFPQHPPPIFAESWSDDVEVKKQIARCLLDSLDDESLMNMGHQLAGLGLIKPMEELMADGQRVELNAAHHHSTAQRTTPVQVISLASAGLFSPLGNLMDQSGLTVPLPCAKAPPTAFSSAAVQQCDWGGGPHCQRRQQQQRQQQEQP